MTIVVSIRGGQDKLALARAALRQGNSVEARRLIRLALQDNPRDVTAWSWACQAAATTEEKIYCLQQILAIDPTHAAAHRYLAQLQPSASAIKPSVPAFVQDLTNSSPPAAKENHASIANVMFAPLGCLLQTPATILIAVVVVLALAGAYIYFNVNTDFMGLADPKMDSLAVSPSFERVDSSDVHWQITYEKPDDSQFAGKVRHVSPIHEPNLLILTHDILVTSGDYANPTLVSTSVFDHHFSWRSPTEHPNGTINLLHTVPANEDIYRQLLNIRVNDNVIVTGHEILKIDIYDQKGVYRGDWHDTGCNSLVVKSVMIDRAH